MQKQKKVWLGGAAVILTFATAIIYNSTLTGKISAPDLKASLVRTIKPSATKIGNQIYQAPRVLQNDEFAVAKTGSATGQKRIAKFTLKSGATYTTEVYQGQSISIVESDGKSLLEINNDAEVHNLAELYNDPVSRKALVSPVVSDVLKKKDTVPVIIRYVDSEKHFVINDTPGKRNEKKARFFAKRESTRNKIAAYGNVKDDLPIINAVSADIKQEALNELRNDPNVQRIEYDTTVYAVLDQSVPQIGTLDVWKNFDSNNNLMTGIGMKIAIIDTGVDYKHPDLGGCLGIGCKVTQGYDFVNNDADPMDDQGHGTHVAATAAGKGKLYGVAPDAQIYAYKVLDSGGSGTGSAIIKAIQRATDPNQDGDTSDHVDVGNMSLGGEGNPGDSLSLAVDNSSAAGVVWAIAAGNSGPGSATIGTPGGAASAITVAASCKSSQIGVNSYCAGSIAKFSSRGPVIYNGVDYRKPDVAAPGHLICAAEWNSAWSDKRCIDDLHVAISGTSMATPHVAGALALMRQAYPNETPAQIKTRIKSSATNLGVTYNDQGSGEINLKAAIPSNSQVTVSPSGLWEAETDPTKKLSVTSQNFSVKPTVNVDTLSVSIKNSNAGITVTPDKTTLNVAGKKTDTLTLSVTVDNDVVNSGSYSGISAILSSGDTTLGVISLAVKVKPTFIMTPETIDYGIDNPALANWTSSSGAITFTNLRTDVSRTVVPAISGLPAGTTLNGVPAQITINKGATITLNTTINIPNNTAVTNGFYDKLQFKFTSGSLSFETAAKFYKAYYLDVVAPDQNPWFTSVWDYEKKTTRYVIDPFGQKGPERMYFLTPGKTDVIFRFSPNRLTPSETTGIYVKEGVDLSLGSATLTTRLAELTNSITLTGISETNTEVPIMAVATSNTYRKDGLFRLGSLLSGYPIFQFNNVSSNFISYAYHESIQSNPEKAYFFGWEKMDGITSSQNITNTPQDLKTFKIKANSNLVDGAAYPFLDFGGVGLVSNTPVAPPSKMQTIYYTGLTLPNIFIAQLSEMDCTSTDTAYCPTRSMTPQIELSTGNLKYSSLNTSYCSFNDKIENGGTMASGAPVFFAGRFGNRSTSLQILTGNCQAGYYAYLFRGQDYSRLKAPEDAYLIKNSSGTVIANSTFPVNPKGSVFLASNLAAGTYTFEIPSRKYFIQNSPYYASVAATIKLGAGLTDYNPPAIEKLTFYSNGEKNEAFVPGAGNKVELMLNPVGGTLVAEKASYSIDGSVFTDAAVTPGSPVTTVDIPAIPDTASKLTIKVYAMDAAGNDLTYKFEVPKSNSKDVDIDTMPPTVSITSPANNSSYSKPQTVSISAGTSDNVGVSKVEFYDGATKLGTDTTSPYSYDWEITAINNGTHSLTAKAYDAKGNTGNSSVTVATVNISAGDKTAPAVSLTVPVAGTTYNTARTITLNATAFDDVGVTKVEFYNGSQKLGEDDSSPYNLPLSITSADNGTHSLNVKAYDAAGNIGTSRAVSVTVNIPDRDSIAPTISLTMSGTNTLFTSAQPITLNGAAFDNVGVAKVEFYDGSKKLGEHFSVPYSYIWPITSADNGTHSLTAKAYDAAGNSAVSVAISVTINIVTADITKPTVSISAPTADSKVNGIITIKTTATDNKGINRVEFYVDNVLKSIDLAQPYHYPWNTTAETNGTHTIYAKAYNKAGNANVSATISVTTNSGTVVSGIPTVLITSPAANTTVSGQSVTLSATAKDDKSISMVSFHVDGAMVRVDTTYPYAYLWNSKTVSNGTHVITAKAYDANTNVRVSIPIAVTVNN